MHGKIEIEIEISVVINSRIVINKERSEKMHKTKCTFNISSMSMCREVFFQSTVYFECS